MKFYVTITTSSYFLLENKVMSISPISFGPIFIHAEKTLKVTTISMLLYKLEPNLNAIHALGTDDKEALNCSVP